MARANDLGALHGDLKSDNIVIVRRADGTDLVKVLDFGIPLSHADALPRHRAGPATGAEPAERVRLAHAEAGASDDLHALGVVFSKMTRSVDSRVEDRLDGLVLHLLQDDPRARPVDAHRVERDLIEIAHALGAALPPDPEVDPASTLAPARALPGARTDAWLERLAIFEAMSSRAYGAPVKADVDSTLAELRALVRKYAELRSAGTKQQRALDEIEARGREGRQRFGFAVDATGLDVSRARDELRSAVAEVEGAAEETKACARAYVRAQDELLAWEGRTAQREPHRELGQAHRTCAAAADGWLEARVREREAQRIAAVKERAVNDLDYQIAELRAALSNHEQGIDRDRDAAQRRIVDLTAQMERIDRRLVELATGFCAPLRGRPELGDLFGSLESRS
jgi:serine/threonine-protein kinase